MGEVGANWMTDFERELMREMGKLKGQVEQLWTAVKAIDDAFTKARNAGRLTGQTEFDPEKYLDDRCRFDHPTQDRHPAFVSDMTDEELEKWVSEFVRPEVLLFGYPLSVPNVCHDSLGRKYHLEIGGDWSGKYSITQGDDTGAHIGRACLI